VADIPTGEARRFAVDGHDVAVVNLGDEGIHALEAVCSHEHAWLDEGDVDLDEGTIECPKHGSTFDVLTGRPRSLPAVQPVTSYPVTVDGDDILIEV
jgi:3-phenylpropionate/trans-cinnamate dioxygenase ferredoxin subunit